VDGDDIVIFDLLDDFGTIYYLIKRGFFLILQGESHDYRRTAVPPLGLERMFEEG
jgi:hypothetical protein